MYNLAEHMTSKRDDPVYSIFYRHTKHGDETSIVVMHRHFGCVVEQLIVPRHEPHLRASIRRLILFILCM